MDVGAARLPRAAMPAIACADLAFAITTATADRRFATATVVRAAAALEPLPAFVADVAREREPASADGAAAPVSGASAA